MDKPAFEFSTVEGQYFKIYESGFIEAKGAEVSIIINRIPLLIEKAREQERDTAQANEYRD